MIKFNSKNKYLNFIYNLLIIILFGGILWIGYRIYTSLSSKFDKSVDVNDDLVSQSTLSDGEARTIVNRLMEAMNRLGTDELLIRDTLASLTRADFEKVYKIFGKKAYNSIAGMEYDFLVAEQDMYTLEQWFYHELSLDEYDCISKVFGKTTAFPLGVAHDLKAYEFITLHHC